MRYYLWCLTTNDTINLVLAWLLDPFVVDEGDVYGELVKVVFGEFVPISIHYVPIIDEFGETCDLGSLGKISSWNLRWWKRTT